MKTNLPVILFFCLCLALNAGCKKTAPATDTNTTTSTDPAVLILGKWQVVKDSIVVHQFQFSDGTIPIPGVYYGSANDYYLFQNTGTVIILEGGPQLSSTYRLTSNTSLLIDGFAWGDVNILTLNSTTFIWDKTMTSGTSGTYYRRTYFRK